jgi:hypothetical protein
MSSVLLHTAPLPMHNGSDVFGSIYVVARKKSQRNFNSLLLNPQGTDSQARQSTRVANRLGISRHIFLSTPRSTD